MYRRILVPIDGSPTSARGLDEAVRMAQLTGAVLKLVHVLDEIVYVTGFEAPAVYMADLLPAMKQTAEKILAESMARVAQAGVKAETAVLDGNGQRIAELVAAEASRWHADLIVIGTHGRRGATRLFLGSDAEKILRAASVPVLLVRASERTAETHASASSAGAGEPAVLS